LPRLILYNDIEAKDSDIADIERKPNLYGKIIEDAEKIAITRLLLLIYPESLYPESTVSVDHYNCDNIKINSINKS
jgi:hypothetical protein